MIKQTPQTVILINGGCKDIQNYARAIRAGHIYTMVMPYTTPDARIMQESPAGIIFCRDAQAKPQPAAESRIAALGVPFLSTTAFDAAAALDFCRGKCGCQGLWTIENFIAESIADIRAQVGDRKVVLGLSGGVDSSVAAALIHRAIGKQLTCVFVNHGLLRLGEPEQVQSVFRDSFDMNLVYVDASDRFLDKLAGVNDPEQKRKIIGKEFIDVFAEEAQKLEGISFLAQGTIYPDILESDGIKSHHNVGGLPEDLQFELVEPVKLLYKDEVRVVGKALGLPDNMVYRQPFPGPGLGVRCIGAITRDRLEAVRESDAILREEFAKNGLEGKVWQYFTVVPDIKSTGIIDGKRSFDWPVIIRAVNTVDAVTAEVAQLDFGMMQHIVDRITHEVSGVNRVLWDLTPKPTGTIEWE